jgi:SAM-dependent methyltransferase
MSQILSVLTFLLACGPTPPDPAPVDPAAERWRATGMALFESVGWTYQWRDAGRLAHQLTQRHGDLREELDALAIPAGAVVADIGCGVGWYTFPLAHAVGPTGRVLALDIQPEAVALVAARAREARLDPWRVVEARQSRVDDCGVAEATLDVAFMAHLGFYLQPELLDENVRMLASVFRAVKPGGRLELLEYLPPGRTEKAMLAHLAAAGFTLESSRYFAKYRTWHLSWRRPTATPRPRRATGPSGRAGRGRTPRRGPGPGPEWRRRAPRPRPG